jgi:putative ABC transport system permease protein
MIIVYWFRSLLRTAAGRMVFAAGGIALAVALCAVLGAFVISAAETMTAQAIANVPVDWQIEIASGADRTGVEHAIAEPAAPDTTRAVEYANVGGFSAVTGDTQQVTGAGKVIGIARDYVAIFPNQITLISGSLDGPVLFTQTAANLHAGINETVTISRIGLPLANVVVTGIAAMPNIDSLMQAVGVPSGLAPQSPPDNILIVPETTWHELFDAQRAARPDSAHTQLHVRLDRSGLPHDPVGAYRLVKQMGNNFEARVAGSAALANNLAARLDGVRGDALYAKALFLFLGTPGVVLAALITIVLARAGRSRRLREQALLRIRGARLWEALGSPAVEAVMIGSAGATVGLGIAYVALLFLGTTTPSVGAKLWMLSAAVAGLCLAVAAILVPALSDARHHTVASARVPVDTRMRSTWERLWLDLVLLLLAGAILWSAHGTGYEIVLASEGVAQTSVHYEAFLAPLALWAGAGLLWVRVSRLALTAMPALRNGALKVTASDLAPTVGASLSRQSTRLARGVGILALATAFAISTAIFNITYDGQARVDAELTNGADVNITGSTAHPAGSKLAEIRATASVAAAEPMMHRYAYVGTDLQDLFGIDPRSIGKVTTMANAYFATHDASGTLAALTARRDGVLVSDETVQDFQLQLGDTLNLRLQSALDRQYHVIPFTFIGVVREFPTAPKDSFLVANADYIAEVTGTDAHEVVLVRASDPSATTTLKSALALDPAFKVTALGDVRSLIATSLTAISLAALTKLELAFGLALIAIASGLVLALGFVERNRTYAILRALGASTSQLGAFLRSEAALVTTAGLVFGTLTGFAVAWMLVTMLTGVFDPPPESPTVPMGYLSVALIGAAVVAAMTVVIFGQLHARTDPAALKLE